MELLVCSPKAIPPPSAPSALTSKLSSDGPPVAVPPEAVAFSLPVISRDYEFRPSFAYYDKVADKGNSRKNSFFWRVRCHWGQLGSRHLHKEAEMNVDASLT